MMNCRNNVTYGGKSTHGALVQIFVWEVGAQSEVWVQVIYRMKCFLL